jgi:putative ABC transport system permease protein
MFVREWRQQVLMLALLTVAVAGAVGLAAMAVGGSSHGPTEFGAGGALTKVDTPTPAVERLAVAEATRQFGLIDVIRHRSVDVPGSPRPLDVRGQDPHGRFGRPLLALRSGRYPTKAGEVALTDGAAALLGAKVGGRVELGDGGVATVVGLVENPANLRDEFALVSPDDGVPASSLTILLATGRHVGDSSPPAVGSERMNFLTISGGNDRAAAAAGVIAVTTLAMVLVALVAAAGFLVVAHRRQRQLGLLAALGASARHQRFVLLANGAFVGVASAVAGAALGIAGWVAAVPVVENAVAHRISRFSLPWSLIVACMGLSVLAAVGASWWPARTLTRQPIMTSLGRRPPTDRRPWRRGTAAAVVLAVAGFVAIAFARSTGQGGTVRPPLLVGGIVGLVLGVVLLAPLAIRALAVPAARLPFSVRLALRDLVRYQGRASAALAAITLGLGVSVSVAVVVKSNQFHDADGNLSNRQLLIQSRHQPGQGLGDIDETRSRLDATADAVVSRLRDERALRIQLDVAVNRSSPASVLEPVAVVSPILHGFRFVDDAYVAHPSVLSQLGIDPPVASGPELLTAETGALRLFDPGSKVRPDPDSEKSGQPVVRLDGLPAYTSAPRSFVTEAALAAHGWTAVRSGWLIEASHPLTAAEVTTARSAAAAHGVTVESRDTQSGLATASLVATLVGALLALSILAMTIGLIRGEGAGDLRTLTATGAGPRTRRSLTAGTAGALGLLGAVLGTGGAYLALVAAYRSDLARLGSPPLAPLTLVVVGTPLVAWAGGWLLAGREPSSFSRPLVD